jgi:FAD/FMN-containing dehydrogenase
MQVLYPQSIEEATSLMARAARDGQGVIPAGSLSRLEHSLNLKKDGPSIISTARLKTIASVEPGNLLVIAEAGLTPDELDEILLPTGLYWPVTGLGRRTLGAIMAEGALGAETMARGSMPDWVLGASFITAEGKLVASGGRTLKNVAGYDYTRLAWRSFGRLGLCVRFILKLIPRPPRNPVVELPCASAAEAASLAQNIILNKMGAEALRITYSRYTSSLLVWLAGFPEAVAAQKGQLEAMAAKREIKVHDDGQAFWREHAKAWQPEQPGLVPLMGKRRALLDLAKNFAANRASLDADIDLGGGRASLKFEEGVSGEGLAKTFGLTFDRFTPAGPLYERLKKGLDPKGLFFPAAKERGAQ